MRSPGAALRHWPIRSGRRRGSGIADGGTRRLWEKDATLWTGADEAKWLGWLGAIDAGRQLLPTLQDIAAGVRRDGFTHALLLGMGGSSLCPEVLARTFGRQPGAPELHVLDSTVPSQVAAARRPRRPRPHGRHRRQQVGQHARAERVPAGPSSSASPRSAARPRPRAASSPSPTPAFQARGPGQGRRLSPHRVRRADHRRPLLGAVAVRPGAGGGDGPRRRRLPRRDGADGRRHPIGAGRDQSRRVARAAARHRRGRGPRQADAGRLARHRGAGRLARAARRRVHRQERPVDRAGRSRGTRAGRSLRRRPRLRLPAPGDRAGRDAGCRRRRARGRGRGRRADRRRPAAGDRPGVLPLGDRDRRRVHGDEAQSVRSAGRRGQQDRDEGADDGLREGRQPARGGSGRHWRRSRHLRRREDHGPARGRRGGRGTPGGLAARASRLAARRRLRRAARLRRDERPSRRRAAADPPQPFAIGPTSPPASASGRASCTRPARPTRAAPTRASSCRSPPTTPRIWPCRARSTPSA